MKCEKCGKVVAKTHKFCLNCGHKLMEEVEQDESVKNEQPVQTEEKIPVQPQQKVEQPTTSAPIRKTQGFGIAGFVLSLAGLIMDYFIVTTICAILGTIFSSIAMSKYKPTIHKNKGLAIAGFVISVVLLGLIGLDIIFYFMLV